MPSWKKIITSGSNATLNSLYAPSITGSLLGTASYALYAATASYATNIFISGSISDVDYINFQTGSDQPQAVGRLGWDDGYGTLNLGLKGGNVNLAVGQESVVLVYNDEATTLTDGEVVYVSGSQGNRPKVKRAIATNDGYSATTLGIVTEPIASGAEGFVTTFGMVNGLNTLGNSGGSPVWLSPTVSGAWTTTKPTAPGHTVLLGYIVRVSNTVGSIFVHISNGWELGELHDVLDTTTTSSYGDLLVKSGSLWINSKQLTGSYAITGSLTISGSSTFTNIGPAIFSGSVTSTGGFTGSLQGTAATASYVQTAQTASYVLQAVSASYAATSSYATQFNVATGLTASGLIYPSADNGNESYIQTDGAGNLSLQYVKSMYETVRNRETSSITSGIPLFVSGATGANSDVYIADASNPARMPATYIASETIAPSGTGKALISGLLTTINTTGYQAGQELFVNTGSGLTTFRPPYPNSVQLLGIVTRVGVNGQAVILNPGQIEIQNIQPGYVLVGNNIGTPTAVATASLSVASSSFATTASYVLQAVSASFASTASAVNTLNQNVIITGSLTVGATTAGVSENTLTLGPRDNGSEGGQLMLQAPGGTYTSASMWDNYANQTRLLRGSNAGSDALVASFNMHTKQMQLPAYTSTGAFPGSAAAFLAVDSSGNLITTSSAGGGGGVTINNNVDNYVITATGTINTLNGESNLQFNGTSLTVTGQITSSGAIRSTANGAMYFRGGDDAEFWDINVANTVGIYGQQDATVASVKLGSGGGIISGKDNKIGINTISPSSSLDVIGSARITGSLESTGSFRIQGAGNGFVGPFMAIEVDDANGSRKLFDADQGSSSIDFGNRALLASDSSAVLSWSNVNGTYTANKYTSHYIEPTVKADLVAYQGTGGQILSEVTFDVSVVDFDLVYLDTTNVWKQVDQTTTSTVKLLGICVGVNPGNQIGDVFIEGDIVVTTNTGYPIVESADYGIPVYIKESSLATMSTVEPTTGTVRKLGFCYYNNGGTEWIMKFRPNN